MANIVWKQSQYGYRYAERGFFRAYVRPKSPPKGATLLAGTLGYRWSVAKNGKTIESGFCWGESRAEERAALVLAGIAQ